MAVRATPVEQVVLLNEDGGNRRADIGVALVGRVVTGVWDLDDVRAGCVESPNDWRHVVVQKSIIIMIYYMISNIVLGQQISEAKLVSQISN